MHAIGLVPLLLQTVWVVDDNGGPGVNFTDLPPAIAAAADGDVLLVRAGTYTPFMLLGKGLRILGDGPGLKNVGAPFPGPGPVGTSVVSNLPPASQAFFEDLSFLAASFLVGSWQPLEISGSATRVALRKVTIGQTTMFNSVVDTQPGLGVDGALVHVFECTVFGCLPSGCNQNAGAALRVSGGGLVQAASCAFTAKGASCCSPISICPSLGGPGIDVTGSTTRVWVADSLVRGGEQGGITFGSWAGPGLRVDSAIARVSGVVSSITQGGSPSCLGMSGIGGYGIATSGSAEVTVHSTPVLGGVGSAGCLGQPGAPTSGPGITLNAPSLPVLRTLGTFKLSGSVTITLTNGPPGAFFVIALDDEPAHFGIPGPFLGEFLIGPPPSILIFSGTLSPAGEFSVTIPLSGASPSLAYVPLFLQGAAFDAATSLWRLSNAAAVLLRP